MAHTVQGHAASATQQTAITAMVTAHGTLTNVSLKVQKTFTYIFRPLSVLFLFYTSGKYRPRPPRQFGKRPGFLCFFFFSEPFPKVCALRSVWSLHQQGPAGAFLCGQCFVSPGIQQVCSFFSQNLMLVLQIPPFSQIPRKR